MATKLTDDLLNEIITKFIQGHLDGFENEMTKDRSPLRYWKDQRVAYFSTAESHKRLSLKVGFFRPDTCRIMQQIESCDSAISGAYTPFRYPLRFPLL